MEKEQEQEIKDKLEGKDVPIQPQIYQPRIPYTYSTIPATQQIIQGEKGPVQLRESIKGESRIEYIPYEKVYIEYEAVQKIERVPRERKIIEYEEVTHTEYVPKEKKVTDYYAVEYQTEYIPQVYTDKYIEYIPQERLQERVEYQAVEKQVVHQPVVDQQAIQQEVKTIVQPTTVQYQYVQQPVGQYQYVQQPLSQSVITKQQQPLTYSYINPTTTKIIQQPVTTILPAKKSGVTIVQKDEKQKPGFFESLFGD